jgi:hypothetical protein
MARMRPAGEEPADSHFDSLRKRLGPTPAISAEDQSRQFLEAAISLGCDEGDEQPQAYRDELERSRS